MTLVNGLLYEALFKAMINGFSHCRAIYNVDGKMHDWIYVLVNPAFEEQTGLKDVEGKSVSVLLPTLYSDNPGLFEIYERVAKTGLHESFEMYVPSLDSTFEVSAYSVEKHTFTTVFENISEKKKILHELHLANEDVLMAFVTSLEYRDHETEKHTLRVADLSVKLGTAIKLSDADIVNLRRGALLHDIGKVRVPDEILRKPGVLTDEEWIVMKKHPQTAFDLLSSIKYLKTAIDIPYCHHEKWDGSGYPRGLRGEAIPLLARIFTIVDYYDALISERPYRGAYPFKEALTIMDSENGVAFDPEIYRVFKEMIADE